jgi:hypothetical protein
MFLPLITQVAYNWGVEAVPQHPRYRLHWLTYHVDEVRTAASNVLIVHPPGVIWEWRAMVMMMMMMPTGKTPDSSNRALWKSYQQRHLGASMGNGRRSKNFAYQYLRYVNGSLTYCKILRHGTCGFTSHPKERVLRTPIAIRNSSPRQGLSPQPLAPMASTLAAKPPRQLMGLTRV